jgi:hypothetical protein
MEEAGLLTVREHDELVVEWTCLMDNIRGEVASSRYSLEVKWFYGSPYWKLTRTGKKDHVIWGNSWLASRINEDLKALIREHE